MTQKILDWLGARMLAMLLLFTVLLVMVIVVGPDTAFQSWLAVCVLACVHYMACYYESPHK